MNSYHFEPCIVFRELHFCVFILCSFTFSVDDADEKCFLFCFVLGIFLNINSRSNMYNL